MRSDFSLNTHTHTHTHTDINLHVGTRNTMMRSLDVKYMLRDIRLRVPGYSKMVIYGKKYDSLLFR